MKQPGGLHVAGTLWGLRPMNTVICPPAPPPTPPKASLLSLFLHNSAGIYKTIDDSGARCAILCFSCSFPLWKPGLRQPSTNPHTDVRRVPPICSLPMCYTKGTLKGCPRGPMAGFISWAALLIYIAIYPPLLSPAVIPEQDVAHKSFASAYYHPQASLFLQELPFPLV